MRIPRRRVSSVTRPLLNQCAPPSVAIRSFLLLLFPPASSPRPPFVERARTVRARRLTWWGTAGVHTCVRRREVARNAGRHPLAISPTWLDCLATSLQPSATSSKLREAVRILLGAKDGLCRSLEVTSPAPPLSLASAEGTEEIDYSGLSLCACPS